MSFELIVEKAIKKSYDLKIAEINEKISTAQIKEAKSEYYPTFSLNYGAGYDRDLSNGSSGFNSVGDTVLLGTTRYQNSAYARMQYNLFDFGIRGKKLAIAKKERDQKQIEYAKTLRNLKIEMADLYTKTLLSFKEIESNNRILILNK